MKTMQIEIPAEPLAKLCRQYHISKMSIFGSALREDFRSDSDVDMLVEFGPDAHIGFMALNHLQRELSVLLQRPVDLVPENGLKPRLRQEVMSTAEVIYAA